MTSIQSFDQPTLILGYIVPGLIILYVRSQFLTGRTQPHKDALLSYFTLSIIYLSVVQAITSLAAGNERPLVGQTPYALPISLTGAAAFGMVIGLNASLGGSRRLLAKFGIRVPHAITSAWDWRFSGLPECLMTLTLKDGSRVYGWCGARSFIGSDPRSRDLFIEQVYDVDEQGNWVLKTKDKSIYIATGEVRMIEFIPRPDGA